MPLYVGKLKALAYSCVLNFNQASLLDMDSSILLSTKAICSSAFLTDRVKFILSFPGKIECARKGITLIHITRIKA